MTDLELGTLAYTTSRKSTRRTTFQDELQAAVSARARKARTQLYSFAEEFDDDEDDFLNQLIKSRKKRSDIFKAEKSKTKFNDFNLSGDDSKNGTKKRVSFLKTKEKPSPVEDTVTPQPCEEEPADYSNNSSSSYKHPYLSQHSTNTHKDDILCTSNDGESTDPQSTADNLKTSLSYHTSDDTLDLPLPVASDSSAIESPAPGISGIEEKTGEEDTLMPSARDALLAGPEREPPKPKPRQRTLGLSRHTTEKTAEDAESQEVSRPQTSSLSIQLSTDAFSSFPDVSSPDRTAVGSCSPQWTDGEHADAGSKSSSSKTEQSYPFTVSTDDFPSRDDIISDDSKGQERRYSSSFVALNNSRDFSTTQVSVLDDKCDNTTLNSQSKTSLRPQSQHSKKVESKYLGALKVLDCKVSQESQPQAVDSLRAAIYQEWLKKKKEKLRENMELIKNEEVLREKKRKEEEAKKEDAVASYEAWKEKKAESLKAIAKEKKNITKMEKRLMEEREEKRQSAKQVFERWKLDHDHLLREKYRQQREAERKLHLEKLEEEEARKQTSTSAFSNWCEKKKDILHNKVIKERKENRNRIEVDRYKQEEREKLALETYEHWLTKKDREQQRKREERRIKVILQDSPPPPWSPPNKTIPYRK